MKARSDRRARAAVLGLALALSFGGMAQAGEIKAFSFPVPTFDEQGDELDYEIVAQNAPPADGVIVYGYWPDMKMLLIQLRPDDPSTAVYIAYAAVEMRNQAAWDVRMRASGELVCTAHPRPIVVASRGANTTVTGSKGFKNPC